MCRPVAMPGSDEKNVVSFRVESHGPGARLRLNIVYDVKFIRRILVNHARDRAAAKRGGPAQKLSLDEVAVISPERSGELVALDDALETLAQLDPRKSQIVELRYFGGLTVEEVAEVLRLHPDTVTREWRRAKAFLRREIQKGKPK